MCYWNVHLRVTQWELPACVGSDVDEDQDELVVEQEEEAPSRFLLRSDHSECAVT